MPRQARDKHRENSKKDGVSLRESLSQTTFSDTQIAYALFLALGFTHLVISMATFYTFVQVRVPVIRYMRLRATKLEMMEAIEEGSDSTDSAAQGLQLFRQQAVYITGLKPDLDAMELRPLFRNYGIITALQTPMNATWAVVCFLGEVQDDMVKSKTKGPDGRWKKEFYAPQTKAALKCCQAINSGKLDNQLCVMDEATGKPASAAQVNAEIIAVFFIRMIVLPRQALDKHRENSQKRYVFIYQCRRGRCGARIAMASPTSQPGAETLFLSHLYIKMPSFYQDRLGTNIGKTQNNTRFCRPFDTTQPQARTRSFPTFV
eukprot:COSAG06_NODE_182_length_20899_cov_89.175048_22_plen_318_part_00